MSGKIIIADLPTRLAYNGIHWERIEYMTIHDIRSLSEEVWLAMAIYALSLTSHGIDPTMREGATISCTPVLTRGIESRCYE